MAGYIDRNLLRATPIPRIRSIRGFLNLVAKWTDFSVGHFTIRVIWAKISDLDNVPFLICWNHFHLPAWFKNTTVDRGEVLGCNAIAVLICVELCIAIRGWSASPSEFSGRIPHCRCKRLMRRGRGASLAVGAHATSQRR